MQKKFSVLIEDDWELLGNGLGNVASHQYLPSLAFMKMAKKLDIKLTFMVDVAQQLQYIKHESQDANLRLQRNLWDNTILLMRDYGFDVQLHLHPQWLNASLDGDLFYLNNNWNIGRYDKDTQQELISSAIGYLHSLIRKYEPDYQVIAFKGGSWGLQPSENLLQALENEGVRVVMGVRKGMFIPGNAVDYVGLEEENLPYYPVYSDIRKVSAKREKIFVIPLQSYKPGLSSLFSMGLDVVKQKVRNNTATKFYYKSKIDDRILKLSPVKGNKKVKLGLTPYHTHLKIGNQPFAYLKKSFDATIKSLQHFEQTNIPILIESHTKQFHNSYADIEKFLNYVREKYNGIVEFKDLTTYYRDVVRDNSLIKTKQERVPN